MNSQPTRKITLADLASSEAQASLPIRTGVRAGAGKDGRFRF